jgi:hypothetical protein
LLYECKLIHINKDISNIIIIAVAGAVLMAMVYHLLLYLQLRTKLLGTYSAYLFFTAVYMVQRSIYPDRHHPPLEKIDLDEVLQMLTFAFYIRFMWVALSVNKLREKLAYKFLKSSSYVIAVYIIINPVLLVYLNAPGTNYIKFILVIVIRSFLLIAGFIFLIKVVKKKNEIYYKYIGAGAISIIFFGGLATLVHIFSPDGFIISAVAYTVIGFFSDVLFFSSAVGFQMHKNVREKADVSRQLAEVQLTALSAQMNPHFIFNCMNSIQKYILKSEKNKAMLFLQNFSELMRGVLDSSSKMKIGLDEEINMLEKYLTLEQQRLESKFDYIITASSNLQTDFFEIPGMLIQPYVENAIWHGLMNLPDGKRGSLAVTFEKEKDFIKCIVTDNGVGRDKAAELEKEKSPHRKSYGISISKKRIELLQKEGQPIPQVNIEDLVNDNGQPSGTSVTLFILAE